jgi:adenosylmethionine-8-amino-7-oxononanoate aminotransferase
MEVAIKMALQYQQARGQEQRHRLLTIRGGYHGDTMGAMSVCDPVNGMHTLFSGVLARQHFAPRPSSRFGGEFDSADFNEVDQLFERHGEEVAAIVVEPIVQGAGGMWFYHPDFLSGLKERCEEHGALLVVDEIAAGFGRTGTFWGVDHAGVVPDIMAVGKALTGGYLTMAATLATDEVAETISAGDPGVFMHGPTFMGNPLAAAISSASIDLLEERGWREDVGRIEAYFREHLKALERFDSVEEVRMLGAIGVVQVDHDVDVGAAQKVFIEKGAWIRPFRNLIYLMPPYISADEDLGVLVGAIRAYVSD